MGAWPLPFFIPEMTKHIFKNARFVKSVTDIKQKPSDRFQEIAFVGRSNVGKSSLLNSLLNRKGLAKTSSTPGKTRLINYFLVDEKYYFVDLPGYGYAKLPKQAIKTWQKMLETYILHSVELKLVCLLIDSRRDPQELDMQMADWLHMNHIPFIIILTKSDKLTKNQLQKARSLYALEFPDHTIISYSTKNSQTYLELSQYLFDFLID